MFIFEITATSNVADGDVIDENKVTNINFKENDIISVFDILTGKRYKIEAKDVNIFHHRLIQSKSINMILSKSHLGE